jgi:alpha-glucosidase
VLSFTRDPGFRCLVNLSDQETDLPADAEVLLASEPLSGNKLPVDATVWLKV